MNDRTLRIVDASWYFPAEGLDPAVEFAKAHIPGAVFFDIDAVADRSTDLPHMLPEASAFEAAAGALGLGSDSGIVIYDQIGLRSAPRVWWTLRAMGHDWVWVLDGGLPKWRREGRACAAGSASPPMARFRAAPRPDRVTDLAQMRAIVEAGARQIVDARPAARFLGEAPEPRPGLRRGHMPDALNLPVSLLVGPDGVLRRPEALRSLFELAGVNLQAPLVTTCGSGITAASLALALAVLGRWDVPVYDGSWAEWGAHADTPVSVGAS